MLMQTIVERYSLDKIFIAKGQLNIEDKDQSTILNYSDEYIVVSENGLYHPTVALSNLRLKLEGCHNSILAINGCRIDTTYRATGSDRCYLIETGKQATISVNMFAATNDIEKLCTLEIHQAAYKAWQKSLDSDNNPKIKRYHSEEILFILFICAADLSNYNEQDLTVFAEAIEGRIEVLFESVYLLELTDYLAITPDILKDFTNLKEFLTGLYSDRWRIKMKNSIIWNNANKISNDLLQKLKIERIEPKKFVDTHMNF